MAYIQAALAAYQIYGAVQGQSAAKDANKIKQKQADLDNYISRRRQRAATRRLQSNVANVAAQTGQAGGSGALGASASIASQEAATLGTASQIQGLNDRLYANQQERQQQASYQQMAKGFASVATNAVDAYDAYQENNPDPTDDGMSKYTFNPYGR